MQCIISSGDFTSGAVCGAYGPRAEDPSRGRVPDFFYHISLVENHVHRKENLGRVINCIVPQ